MLTIEIVARGDAPHSSTTNSELVGGLVRKFEQELSEMVARVTAEQLSPAQFSTFMSDLQQVFAAICRDLPPNWWTAIERRNCLEEPPRPREREGSSPTSRRPGGPARP